ncbi:MAG: GTP cyclohydrolase I FolE [Peptoniphilaceae bacterium]|nr:GTP cyclohydrolase I FolE [Peptoniphilaceae bacterium]
MDREKIEKAVSMIIDAIGENPNREGLIETPQRVAKMYEEIFQGLDQDPKEHLAKTFELVSETMVAENDIPFFSMCEHHLLPFWGKCSIAYVPNGRVAGLSKLARTVDVFAKRPQLQERITLQVAKAIMDDLSAKGVVVVTDAEHMCMNMRGVKKPGTYTRSVVSLGDIDKDDAFKMMGL